MQLFFVCDTCNLKNFSREYDISVTFWGKLHFFQRDYLLAVSTSSGFLSTIFFFFFEQLLFGSFQLNCSFLRQLLFRRTKSFRIRYLRKSYFFEVLQIFQNSYFFNNVTFAKEVLFQNSYFFRTTAFSKHLLFGNIYFFRKAVFSSTYLAGRATFQKRLLFHSYTFFLQLHFLFIKQ